jgi:hypothetical protein
MVLRSSLVMLIALQSIAYTANLGFRNKDSLSSDSAQQSKNMRITLDLALMRGPIEGDNWHPRIGIRAGFGTSIARDITFCGHLEFFEFDLAPSGGPSYLSPKSAKRKDLAIYGGVLVYRIIEAGCGTYYTASEKVDVVYPAPLGMPSFSWTPSGWSGFRFFWTIGLRYEVRLTEGLFMPVGLSYRDPGYGSGAIPIFLRVGIGLKL